MKQKICQFILKIIGWKAVVTEEIPQKCIFCVAPHTSNLDFILGKIMFCAIGGKRPSFLIKKEWFIFPFGLIFNRIGGIPVDRSKKTSLVDQIVKRFEEQDRFQVAITPEGTRKANPKWKMGFYHIAKKAQVPILLTYFDYKKKEIGIDRHFIPTDDEKEDMRQIKLYFKDVVGRHPEGFTIGNV
ncbi:MAG: 1-acyl-sn-glycerol-3-phosphate acyltransferase [Paludibacteraceae bacterium]|nr:1-acyl-sn-glycerol-3-phosphate acyltransferase [Paludibacteraceae bacterium]MBR4840536.1 1-acyl-sn-glycerol-3-phosphate acyltransferase [Paludibacteraceae bacterium]